MKTGHNVLNSKQDPFWEGGKKVRGCQVGEKVMGARPELSGKGKEGQEGSLQK